MKSDRAGHFAKRLFAIYATVFVVSFCIMVIELVGERLTARFLGSSLHTWTSIIGIVLTGIAVGNFLGGRVADMFTQTARRGILTLATLLLLAGGVSAGLDIYNRTFGGMAFLQGIESWPLRTAVHMTLTFLPAATLLGTISPVAAKQALDLGRRRGQTIGSVYAWSIAGSILGTFVSGFYLIESYSISTIIRTVSIVMFVLGLIYLLFGIMSRKENPNA